MAAVRYGPPSMSTDLKRLSQGLTSEDLDVREEAAHALAQLEDPQAAPYLSHALDDEAEQVRMWGAYGLGMLGRKEDLPKLEKALKEDSDPVVRVWAAFGLARTGSREGFRTLLALLDDPGHETRTNAGDALLSLERPEELKTLLQDRLSGPPPRRAWAAGLLHRLGDPRGLPVWRQALQLPEARVDAALVAGLMEEPAIARDLLHLLVELPLNELETQTGDEGPLLAEVLSAPLLSIDLDAFFGEAREDDALRAELLLLLGRNVPADPQAFDSVHEFLSLFPSEQLGREVSALLLEQAEPERPLLLSNFATLIPDAVVPSLENLDLDARKALFARVVDEVTRKTERGMDCYPLVELLHDSKYAAAVAALPRTEPGEDEGDAEEGAGVEDLPPEAREVAERALTVAGVLHRLNLEQDLAAEALTPAQAQRAHAAHARWMEDAGLSALLNPFEAELMEKPIGGWSEDDRATQAWAAEELAILLWALHVSAKPAIDQRVDAKKLLAKLPMGKDTGPFLESAALHEPEELAVCAELLTLWKGRAEQEALGRHLRQHGLGGDEIDLDALIGGLEAEGFDRKAIEKTHGTVGMVVEALRYMGRLTAKQLHEAGALPSLAQGDFPFRGKPLAAVSDDELTIALTLTGERARAATWVASGSWGDEGDPNDDEEPGDA